MLFFLNKLTHYAQVLPQTTVAPGVKEILSLLWINESLRLKMLKSPQVLF